MARSKLRPLTGRRSKVSLKNKTIMIQMVLLQIMTYAAVAWGYVSKTMKKRLQAQQNMALREAVDAPWYVPNRVLYDELRQVPVVIQMKERARKFFEKNERHRNVLIRDALDYDPRTIRQYSDGGEYCTKSNYGHTGSATHVDIQARQLQRDRRDLDEVRKVINVEEKSMEEIFHEEEPVDDSDLDRDYHPDKSSSMREAESDEGDLGNHQIKRSRKRVRNESSWIRNNARKFRNSGGEFIGHRKLLKPARAAQDLADHHCRYQCNSFSNEDRQQIFEDYWNLSSWNLQTAFLTACMETRAPLKRKLGVEPRKQASVQIKLVGKRVCKLFLLKTLNISQKRYDNVLKKRNRTGVAPTDQRGRHTPANKISDNDIAIIKGHIKSFPKYSSHYSRVKNPHTKYLSGELSIHKMYNLYLQYCQENNIQNPVKESFYRFIFTTQFNLRFKRPHTDTCTICDILENKINNDNNPEVVNDSKIQKEIHLRKAEQARSAKNDVKKLGKDNPNTVNAICFDLEKTLPTPVLTCSKVFYLRQLWTYNFAIHNLANDQASMFMWHEGEASRGSQEIGSCLLRYVQQLPNSVEHIIAFSDNAGGQNKNNNIIKFWRHIVQTTSICRIDHKFLISGHSYMECDQDFGLIEKSKKKNQYVFVPDDWSKIVAQASRKFTVVRMRNEDFLSVEQMKKEIKDSIPGIRNIQWFRLEKDKPNILQYKNTLNEEMDFVHFDLRKQKKGRPNTQFDLTLLYPEPPSIKTAKYENLQQLLQFIPPIYHNFYSSLRHRGSVASATNENREVDANVSQRDICVENSADVSAEWESDDD
ncbi:unnamed protein product [Acanthoscelides obtectus]|uniref:DUF7869 domain-containing protein n=1 Tax=Acanthoscelides obtectus TaxID=200917 RepID=A0A9P0KXF1_ACAOB|nr:unnamed protein product [Acanthoscelides obtectus]CAK1681936.1 hypothetical protein AOBTE_LOCUS33341 [Acanthoscelides obtectus]